VGATWAEDVSPMTTEELIEKQPTEILDYLVSFSGDGFQVPPRHALLIRVRYAVEKCFEWGTTLAKELKERSLWECDLWQPILWGWTASELTESQLIWVLSFVADDNLLLFTDNHVEELLFVKSQPSQSGLSYAWLPHAERLAHMLWITEIQKAEAESKEEGGTETSDDWTFVALNNRGGKLVWAVMYLLGERRREAARDWTHIPDDYRKLIEQILSDSSRPAHLGRVFVGWNIPFLMNIDIDWVRQKVLPLLDWSKDQKTAEQSWHGFLGMGRLPRDLLPELLPFYEKTFPHVSTKLGHYREDFLRQMAELCFIKDFDPLRNEWLNTFLATIDEKDRARWSSWIGRRLRWCDIELKEQVWNGWIRPYWNYRNSGKPAPLTDGETREMLKWALEFEAFFPEAAQMILQTTAPRTGSGYFFKTFSEKRLCLSYPTESCQLLVHTLRQATSPFFACEDVTALVRQLAGFPELHRDLLAVCDEMTRLECEGAHTLRTELDGE